MVSSNTPATPSRRTFLKGAGSLALIGATAAACGDGKHLSQWYHQYGEKGTEQAAKKYAAAYKKEKVQVQWKPGDYGSALSAALLGKNGPDQFESQFNIQYVQAKQVVALDDVIGDTKSDFNPTDIDTNSYNGHIYGVRMIDDPQMFYYRKSAFQSKGLQPPTTIEELINAVDEFSSGKMKGLYAGTDYGAGEFGIVALHAAGGTQLSSDNTKVGFNTPNAIDAYSKLRTLAKSKGILPQAATPWTDPGAFLNEQVAMQWCGLWAMPAIQEKFKDDFGVFPFPSIGSGGKQVVYSGGWTAFVSAKSKQVDEAKAFLKWLWIDKTDFQEDWALNYGFHIPPRQSIAAKAKKLQSGPAADAVRFNKQFGISDNPYWTPNVSAPYGDMLTNIVRKGNAPKGQVTSAATKVQTALDRLLSGK